MFKTSNGTSLAPTFVARSRAFSNGAEGTVYLLVFDMETRDVDLTLEWDGATSTHCDHKRIHLHGVAREGIEYAGIEALERMAFESDGFEHFSSNVLRGLTNEVVDAVDALLGY